MIHIPFLKVHGSKNDFILIDEELLSVSLTDEQKRDLAIILCDREKSIGADGILFISFQSHVDGRMQIMNADGSEASMCGNGLRCAGRYIMEKTGKDEIVVETKKADLYVRKHHSDRGLFYKVEISPVLFQPSSLPMNTELDQVINVKLEGISDQLLFTALAVPNPHLVSIVDKKTIKSSTQKEIAEYLNGDNPYFPDGVNVSFVYPIKKGEIYVNTFERGVGFTNACGTAMSASSLVAILNGLYEYEKPLKVYNNGGYVQTIVHNQNEKVWIDLIGNATFSFKGNVNVDLATDVMESAQIVYVYQHEEEQYELIEKEAKEKLKNIF